MRETLAQLKGDFVVLDLGSAHTASLLDQLPGLRDAVTLVEVDPLLAGAPEARPNRICLKKAVAGTAGKRLFRQRKFPDCSSFLEPKAELVRAYGLDEFFVQVNAIELECDTIGHLLQEHGISRVDLFKTDLEGLDFEVLASAPELTSRSLCVQSELRFQPFYEGEPPFHETASYLARLGFELISLRPAIWKYLTANRRAERDGRTVWADAVFFLGPEQVRDRFGAMAGKAFAKQIILARLMGLVNFGEYRLDQSRSDLPESARQELRHFLAEGLKWSHSFAGWLNGLPLGWGVLEAGRRFFRGGYRTTALYKHPHVGVPDLI